MLAGVFACGLVTGVQAQHADTVTRQDVLNVVVLDQPDLSGKFTVGSDGTFAFPLLGRVPAEGFAVTDVQRGLEQLLGDGYLKDPHVSLSLERSKAATVYIMGEVRQSGGYPLTPNMTLVELLARAGSTTDRAATVAVLTRSRDGSAADGPSIPNHAPQVIRVNLDSLQHGASAQNIVLSDGDTIFVPRAANIYVVGAVKNAGSYVIGDQMTVLQALALAGGLNERGSSRRIRVVRQSDPAKKQQKVKLSHTLQPGDTIVVGEGLF
jgi:polysaccharide export outer membrane protein